MVKTILQWLYFLCNDFGNTGFHTYQAEYREEVSPPPLPPVLKQALVPMGLLEYDFTFSKYCSPAKKMVIKKWRRKKCV
jgi:hypothetical protein